MIVFDIEANDLLDKVTKIHCLSYYNILTKKSESFTDYKQIKSFLYDCFVNKITLIGHNIIKYDIPVFKKILDIDYKFNVIDTLGLSWYLYLDRKKHGLELWGEELGIAKPKIEDWESLSIKDYINRCEEDVKINTVLWLKQESYLNKLYPNGYNGIINYLNFKLSCLRDQEITGVSLDITKCHRYKHELDYIINDKIEELSKYMPKVLLKSPPKNKFKKDGTLSKHGENWLKTLQERGLPPNSQGIYKKGNPGSDVQLKKWLFELGWKPETFKTSKATGKELPQVSLPYGAGLCPSVIKLFEVYKFLIHLEGLYKARHRLGLFKSYLENVDENNKIYPTAHGFTNTLRMKHAKPTANLPKVGVYYGEQVRSCMKIPDSNHIMCGADISGLESTTQDHYMYFFDPKYVKEKRVPGFDPHCDIAILAGFITKEEEKIFKDKSDEIVFKKVKEFRGLGKTTNFSATYGAGAAKIASTAGISLKEGKKLHKIYWDRNSAIKKTAKSLTVKEIEGQKWLFNPVSKFWYYLKADKDKFSTLNQGTGVYVFDTWLRYVAIRLKALKIKVAFQYHDELLIICHKKYKNVIDKILVEAMKKVNETLKLNVEVDMEAAWGNNYAEVH